MRLVLDACVLYPTILREILSSLAHQKFYEPLFSKRILEEWRRATQKLGDDVYDVACAEVALWECSFPQAMVDLSEDDENGLFLPDENDIHVLAAAIKGRADAILTFNTKDFPKNILASHGIIRRDPDGFLWELYSQYPDQLGASVLKVHHRACEMAQKELSLKLILKRLRLNRLAKAMV